MMGVSTKRREMAMLIDQNALNYLNLIQQKIDAGEILQRKPDDNCCFDEDLNYCTECEELIGWMNQEGHIIMRGGINGEFIVAICCEGYFPIDIDYKK